PAALGAAARSTGLETAAVPRAARTLRARISVASRPPGTAQWGHVQPLGRRHQSLPSAARGEPGRLAPLGRGGLRRGAPPQRAGAALRRLRGLPLVPRDGARV